MALPTLVYSKGSKINADVAIYANFGHSLITKRLYNGGEVTEPNCSGLDCDGDSWSATVLTTPNGSAAMGAIPAYAPLYTAATGQLAPAGDVLANLVCLPNTDNDFLICYDQSFDPQLGSLIRAVPRKYNPVDHIVPQRAENTLRLSDFFVSNYDGLRSINGRLCTIIAKVFPKGGGACQEVIYFGGALLNGPPIMEGSDANSNIELSFEGSFSFCAVFSALKP